ncbi:F-box/LRR-repeat protein 13-like [Spinacia oleracea]|uniref:F-box/LRR-repeat protein 13-like n=1 Tax=Spinacia oleracea TaxID=3562 RepID=A0ABM3QPV0_SPIOL|nr:F-box/LRR-repeat protein 13-like [Spinacia oleracea]
MLEKDEENGICKLPRSVIHGIMERLPLKDGARMSILSSKWRNNWRTLPGLVLDDNFFIQVLGYKLYSTHEYSRIVSKILLQHKGPITKFSLDIPEAMGKDPDVYQWIQFLSGNYIKEFTLTIFNKLQIQLPSPLFSCPNLTKLRLRGCVFKPPRSFKGFQYLVSVDFEDVYGFTISKFVAKCPLLEDFSLRNHNNGVDQLCGVLRTLPLLEFTHVRNLDLTSFNSCSELFCTIRIIQSCPNVETLHISVKVSEKMTDSVEFNLTTSDLSYKFLQLRNVTVRFDRGSGFELKLIVEFLLACSPVLEMINLEINEQLNAKAKLNVSKKLMQFHKAFSNIIIFTSMASRVDQASDTYSYSDDEDEEIGGYSSCNLNDTPIPESEMEEYSGTDGNHHIISSDDDIKEVVDILQGNTFNF